ncbi:AraC family transcriptional regulator [Paenibacillus sp. J2TS4]|uniref:helix-turn-helix domain-containing protein n=1 Tax=Paenibacillus sp. J2TS4 TaxID=2807194 RepID=UPI001BD11E2B|nr:AraC family transcriptional regulator [Paenibacillus sp. J2TS4]
MNIDIYFPNMTSTLQIVGCHFSVKPPGWSFPNHHHHLFELLYCWGGSVTHIINGHKLQLHAGDWLLLKSGVRHEMENKSEEPYSFFNLHFDIDDPKLRQRLSHSPYGRLTKEEALQTNLSRYIQEIEQLLQRSLLSDNSLPSCPDARLELTYDNQIALQAFTLLIVREIVLFLSSGKSGSDLPAPHKDATQNEADTAHIIAERLQSMVLTAGSVSTIAEELHLSRSQCSKIFTKIYGIPPRQYLSRLKLNKAKELLVNSDMTIEAIASRLGFGSISHFSRQFRRWVGKSPSQFRPKYTLLNDNKPTNP